MSAPNFELLKDAYAIIDGIPEHLINLSYIVSEKGESPACGTICCAAGWLAHHPQFQALGLSCSPDGGMLLLHGSSNYLGVYADQLAEVFGISYTDAADLFDSADRFEIAKHGTHKQIWLNRMWRYLDAHKQLTPAQS